MSGRRIALALPLLVLAGGTLSEAAHHAKPPPCSLKGSRTIYRDRAVRIYVKTSADKERETRYGCLLSRDKRVRLAESSAVATGTGDYFVTLAHMYVAPPFIGYYFDAAQRGVGYAGPVVVVDLRTGSRRQRQAYPPVVGLGLTSQGSLAWMDAPPGVGGYAVRKFDASAQGSVTLDSGGDIDPDSFAVGGTHVYWMKAGAPQTAPMP
jgi:hypothetical protein